jgi:hypothetical protein
MKRENKIRKEKEKIDKVKEKMVVSRVGRFQLISAHQTNPLRGPLARSHVPAHYGTDRRARPCNAPNFAVEFFFFSLLAKFGRYLFFFFCPR